jgi:hypothetical protein
MTTTIELRFFPAEKPGNCVQGGILHSTRYYCTHCGQWVCRQHQEAHAQRCEEQIRIEGTVS